MNNEVGTSIWASIFLKALSSHWPVIARKICGHGGRFPRMTQFELTYLNMSRSASFVAKDGDIADPHFRSTMGIVARGGVRYSRKMGAIFG